MKHLILMFLVFGCAFGQQQRTKETESKLDKAFNEVIDTGESLVPVDSVMNKSFITQNGEKVLRFELVLDTSLPAVWNAFTNESEITTWEVAVVKLDLRIGGSMQTHYKKNAKIGDTGTITLGITNYLPMELITYTITLTEAFNEQCRNEDDNLQEIIQFAETGENQNEDNVFNDRLGNRKRMGSSV